MSFQEPQRTLGSTNTEIGPIGIGTWSWGDRLGWGYGSDYNEETLYEAFETCLASGITFFDTAEIYGQGKSEEFLGTLLRRTQGTATIATNAENRNFTASSIFAGNRGSLSLPTVRLRWDC